jgi:hypothetical protein
LACSTNAKNSGSAREHVSYHSTSRRAERPSGHGNTPVTDIGGSPLRCPHCVSALIVGSEGMYVTPGGGRLTPGLGATGVFAICACLALYLQIALLRSWRRVVSGNELPGAHSRYAFSVSSRMSTRPLTATAGQSLCTAFILTRLAWDWSLLCLTSLLGRCRPAATARVQGLLGL